MIQIEFDLVRTPLLARELGIKDLGFAINSNPQDLSVTGVSINMPTLDKSVFISDNRQEVVDEDLQIKSLGFQYLARIYHVENKKRSMGTTIYSTPSPVPMYVDRLKINSSIKSMMRYFGVSESKLEADWLLILNSGVLDDSMRAAFNDMNSSASLFLKKRSKVNFLGVQVTRDELHVFLSRKGLSLEDTERESLKLRISVSIRPYMRIIGKTFLFKEKMILTAEIKDIPIDETSPSVEEVFKEYKDMVATAAILGST